MTYKNFEDYLGTQCLDENPTVLDDDSPDFVENWISNLQVEEIMDFADKYGAYMYKDGQRDAVNEKVALATDPF